MKKVQRITDGCQQYEKHIPCLPNFNTHLLQFLMEKVGWCFELKLFESKSGDDHLGTCGNK